MIMSQENFKEAKIEMLVKFYRKIFQMYFENTVLICVALTSLTLLQKFYFKVDLSASAFANSSCHQGQPEKSI